MIRKLKNDLEERLKHSLPGTIAHTKVMGHRKGVDQLGSIPKNARQSAVLILLYPKERLLHTVFILRSTYSGVHSAQIGFPGGKAEPEDRDLEATAIREAAEELSIQPKLVDVIGALTPIYVPPSNFFVQPYIAIQETIPEFTIDPYEVAEVYECPLKDLVGSDKLVSTKVFVNQTPLKVNGYHLNKQVIWGATGMMVKELAEIIEEIRLPIL